MTAKEKRIQERLQQIKNEAAAYAMSPTKVDALKCIGLAEEAAGLGLEVLEGKK